MYLFLPRVVLKYTIQALPTYRQEYALLCVPSAFLVQPYFLRVQSSTTTGDFTISLQKMTTQHTDNSTETCPAQGLLKVLSGKWKPEIFRLALHSPLRFNALRRQINGASKQSLSVALRELEEAELLAKTIIKQKPLHIEYTLTDKGKSLIPVFQQLESLSLVQSSNTAV